MLHKIKIMSWLRRWLALKAAILLAGLLAAFSLVTLVFDVWSERGLVTERAMAFAFSHAERTAEAAIRAGQLDSPEALAALDEALLHEQVINARIVDLDGAVIAERGAFDPDWSAPDTALLGAALLRGEAGSSTRGGGAHVSYPVMIDGQPAGAVRMTASLKGAPAAMGAALRRSMVGILFGLGVILPVSGLYLMRAMRPVREIILTAQSAARGKLDARLDVRTGDELEVLAQSFNTMLDRLKGSLEHVRQLAYADHLTGLPNKTAFQEYAQAALRGADDESQGAMFLVDLDRFKRLNDTFGVKQGDRLIRIAAERLKAGTGRHFRELSCEGAAGPDCCKTVFARVTADEFALVVAGAPDSFSPEALAADIVRAIEQPMEILGQHVVITCSIGIARFPDHGGDPDTLLANANLALDHVKKAGGAGHRLFDEEMKQSAMERVALEHDLRRALDRGEFIVHYQPKVSARTGATTGAEALVRWRLADGAIRGPGNFITVAEETGLIAEMGDFVLREACRAAARWRSRGLTLPVAVNVSALQFERRDFRRTVEEALAESGLPPEWLELEITESTAMTDPEHALAQIDPLRRMGVRFAIDDFGTGHSSLAHLTRMPFDTIKIDQSFVRKLGVDSNARLIVQTILALARSLRLETVAEGAETAEQVAMLQAMGCGRIQGFYFAKPMAEDSLVEFAGRTPEESPTASAEVLTPFSFAVGQDAGE